jgi:phosphate transport system permease protein
MSITDYGAEGGVAAPPPLPRKVTSWSAESTQAILGSLVWSAAIVSLLFFATDLDGTLGWIVCTYFLTAITFYAVTRRREGALRANDRMATFVMTSFGMAVLIPLVAVIVFIFVKGAGRFFNRSTFTDDLQSVGPDELAAGVGGGAKHAIIGTLIQVTIATIVSVPLGVMTAVYLNEIGGRVARIVRFLVEAMSGVPSIVAGLFIYTFWVLQLGKGFTGFSASLALSVLMLPTVTRTSEEMLKLVPGGLREASLALGAPEWRTITRIVLPTARSGLVTASILGVARVAGETAPLILTAFGQDGVNKNPFRGFMSALPLFVYKLIKAPDKASQDLAWAGAFMLILVILVLFIAARVVGSLGRKA